MIGNRATHGSVLDTCTCLVYMIALNTMGCFRACMLGLPYNPLNTATTSALFSFKCLSPITSLCVPLFAMKIC